MEFLNNRFWHTDVTRTSDKTITSEVFYADSWTRIKAILVADVRTFAVEEAYLERLGLPPKMGEKREAINDLIGIEAYLNSGSKLKKALQSVDGLIERSLFSDAVTGFIQSATFLYKERGFSSQEANGREWLETNGSSCRAFNKLNKRTPAWLDYIGRECRHATTYERHKNQQL